MEFTPCNFCGSDQPQKLFDLIDWMTGTAEHFTLVRCENCGLLYLNPRPTLSELSEFYPQQYAPYRVPSVNSLPGRIASWFQQAVWQRRAAWIKRYSGLNGGNLLDVGCASGDFLMEMERNPKWQGTGIEISPNATSTARQRTGSEIIEQDLLDARLPSAFFDLVTFWDVLEHLPKPLESLHKAHDLLKPGGWMVIRVPDPGSLSAHLFKQDWVNHDPPRHFHEFPRELLISRLRQMGFKNVNFHHLTGDYFAFTMSLSIYFSRNKSSRSASLFRSLSRSSILRFLTIPLFILPAWMKMGASIIYLAQKPSIPEKDLE